jgi:hypothetical protein
VPNPSGQNSNLNFNGFVQNPPAYGDKARQGDLQRTAPVAGAGAAASALNAPKRSQRRATRPQQSPQQQPTMIQAPPPQPAQPAYQIMLANAWAEIAQIPGASPLVQQLAQEAQGAGTGS